LVFDVSQGARSNDASPYARYGGESRKLNDAESGESFAPPSAGVYTLAGENLSSLSRQEDM